MVSGLVTSPEDQARMVSGDASWMRMALNRRRGSTARSSTRVRLNRPSGKGKEGDRSPVVACIKRPPAPLARTRYAPRRTGLPPGALPGRIRNRDRKDATASRGSIASIELLELDVEAQALQFLDQHVERLGNAGLGRVLALDDRFVDPRPPRYVVRLDGEQFLKGVGGAVGLERPHLHFAESLPAELCLATEGLLGDQ